MKNINLRGNRRSKITLTKSMYISYAASLCTLLPLAAFSQLPPKPAPPQNAAPLPATPAVQTVEVVGDLPKMVPDLLLPPETQWNHFSPHWIPDFKIPERLDPVLGVKVPVKIFIWHQPGRNMFQTGKESTDVERHENERKAMFSKGITAIVHTASRPSDFVPQGELKTPPVNPYTQVAVGLGVVNDEALR